MAAVQGDGPSWASADAQKFHGRCVRRLEEHVEQLSRERDESLALLRKAHDCSIEDRRAKLGVEAELEATVARLEQVRVEVASRRKMDAVRKVYFDDMADRVEKLDARNRALQDRNRTWPTSPSTPSRACRWTPRAAASRWSGASRRTSTGPWRREGTTARASSARHK